MKNEGAGSIEIPALLLWDKSLIFDLSDEKQPGNGYLSYVIFVCLEEGFSVVG